MSPVTHVTKDGYFPPFLILYVTDHPENKRQSQRLAKVSLEAGVSAKAYPPTVRTQDDQFGNWTVG